MSQLLNLEGSAVPHDGAVTHSLHPRTDAEAVA